MDKSCRIRLWRECGEQRDRGIKFDSKVSGFGDESDLDVTNQQNKYGSDRYLGGEDYGFGFGEFEFKVTVKQPSEEGEQIAGFKSKKLWKVV